jgi:hypothetical protein
MGRIFLGGAVRPRGGTSFFYEGHIYFDRNTGAG